MPSPTSNTSETATSPEPSGASAAAARSAEPSPSGSDEPRTCLNCGAPLRGPYCAECGQGVRDARLQPLHRLVAEGLDEFLSFDARFWRTLRAMLRPGVLTCADLGGRRRAYLPPLRLFLLSGFVLLLSMALSRALAPQQAGHITGFGIDLTAHLETPGMVSLSSTMGTSADHIGLGLRLRVTMDTAAAARLPAKVDSLHRVGGLQNTVLATGLQKGLRIQNSGEQAPEAFYEQLSLMAVLILPLFALLLKGLYRDRLYAEHAVFALHIHAFGFAVLTAYTLLSVGLQTMGVLSQSTGGGMLAGTLVLIAVYGFRALQRVYAGERTALLWKGAVLLLVYPLLTMAVATVHALATLLLA